MRNPRITDLTRIAKQYKSERDRVGASWINYRVALGQCGHGVIQLQQLLRHLECMIRVDMNRPCEDPAIETLEIIFQHIASIDRVVYEQMQDRFELTAAPTDYINP